MSEDFHTEQARKLSTSGVNLANFHFMRQVQTFLGADYVTQGIREMVEMRLIVLVHKDHAQHASAVETAQSATGLGHVYGNKGGVVCKLNLYGTSLCFTSCHLAAHEAERFMLRRNDDVAEVMEEALVGNHKLDIASQFHHSFFMGDLNYRVNFGITGPEKGQRALTTKEEKKAHWDEAHKLVEEEAWDTLFDNDQLLDQQRQRKVFVGWTDTLRAPEATRFRPTFKVGRHHTREQYNPKRTPSYCDRVLHRSLPCYEGNLKLTMFESNPQLTTSDHKPVHAAFEVQTTAGFDVAFDEATCPEMRITGLKATGCLAMDATGKSDPYVKICSDPPRLFRDASSSKISPSSRVQFATLEPSWSKVPDLLIGSADRARLDTCHIILAVLDYDTHSADDPMGYAILPLRDFLDTEGTPKPFSLELLCHSRAGQDGKGAGTISGSIEVLWPKDGQRPAGSRVGVRSSACGSCCVVS